MSALMAMQTYHLTARELYELTCMNDGTFMWFDHCFTIHKLQHDNWDVYVVNAHFLFALQQVIAKLHLPTNSFNDYVSNNQGNKEVGSANKFNNTQDGHTTPSMMTMMMFAV